MLSDAVTLDPVTAGVVILGSAWVVAVPLWCVEWLWLRVEWWQGCQIVRCDALRRSERTQGGEGWQSIGEGAQNATGSTRTHGSRAAGAWRGIGCRGAEIVQDAQKRGVEIVHSYKKRLT